MWWASPGSKVAGGWGGGGDRVSHGHILPAPGTFQCLGHVKKRLHCSVGDGGRGTEETVGITKCAGWGQNDNLVLKILHSISQSFTVFGVKVKKVLERLKDEAPAQGY